MTFWLLFAAYSKQLTANSSVGALNVARWLLPTFHLKFRKFLLPSLPQKNHMKIIALLKNLAFMPVNWVRAHVFKIATTFTIALIVVYGDQIKAAVKRCIRPYPFLVRTLILILLC